MLPFEKGTKHNLTRTRGMLWIYDGYGNSRSERWYSQIVGTYEGLKWHQHDQGRMEHLPMIWQVIIEASSEEEVSALKQQMLTPAPTWQRDKMQRRIEDLAGIRRAQFGVGAHCVDCDPEDVDYNFDDGFSGPSPGPHFCRRQRIDYCARFEGEDAFENVCGCNCRTLLPLMTRREIITHDDIENAATRLERLAGEHFHLDRLHEQVLEMRSDEEHLLMKLADPTWSQWTLNDI